MRLFPAIFILLSVFTSCKKTDQDNRFPAASVHNIDGVLLTIAFDEMTFGYSWNGTSTASLFEECFFDSVDNLQYIIDLPLVSTPGTVFNYSDGASHLLSVIISEATQVLTLSILRKQISLILLV